MLKNYHPTIGEEILDLFKRYHDLYQIPQGDLYYRLDGEKYPDTVEVELGIATKYKCEVCVLTHLPKYNLQTLEQARGEIPKLHTAFIRKLYGYARRQLIHSEDLINDDKIKA